MIELRNIFQFYRGPAGPVEALRGIDLNVVRGEIHGVIGRSGAGKSSLVRVINLLNRPSRGQVLVGGQDMCALDPPGLRAARSRIGMVFQHFNLLSSRTVAGNVGLPLELAGIGATEIRARVDALLDIVGLGALRDHYPAQISGGQKQRVGIARALATKPSVLLSDEATSSLDPDTTRSILTLLQQINRDFSVTIVLVTHQMHVVKQVANRVAVMDAGRIVECGPVIQVFTQPQHPTTRGLVDEFAPQQLPGSVNARIIKLMAANEVRRGQLLRLAFAGDDSDRPILSDLIRRFGLDLNIVHGHVDEIQGRPFGSLAVHVRGDNDQVTAAIAHLRQVGVTVDAQALSNA